MIWKSIFCLLALFQTHLAQANGPKKYNLSICAIFKNESPYLTEWIEYHRLTGVDHFYLYNNGSLDTFKRVLRPYIAENLVTLIHWPDLTSSSNDEQHIWPLSTQVTAYENAIKWVAAKETKWLLFLDIDEFLVPLTSDKITETLEQYGEYPGIVISTEFFDAAKKGSLPQRKLVIESLEITAPFKQDIYRAVEKTILKPDQCSAFMWPPYKCTFKDNRESIKISKTELRINRYRDRLRFQDIEKVAKVLHFNQADFPQNEINELLKLGYEIEDQERAIYRFIPDLYKKLGM